MADDRANDRFDVYYREKLWALIPEVYRFEDGLGLAPDVLRAFVTALATQAATLRRSSDRLWDDDFIDLCDDWAVPYIGDLVATRLLSARNARGRRIDVAKTIYYRRRKGTLLVLEELTRDITGWDGHVVEGFRRLARMHHALDPNPQSRLGTFTKTPPGGLPDLRHPRGAELAYGAFDEFHHMPDVRQNHGGIDGRYNIPKLEVHLYRLDSVPLTGVVPHALATTGAFTFDPSGRDAPLFMARGRSADWRRAREWDLPAPMPCRVLGHAAYVVSVETAAANPGVVPAALVGIPIASEQALDDAVASLPNAQVVARFIRDNGLIADCGKRALYGTSVSVYDDGTPAPAPPRVPQSLVTSGNLETLASAVADFRVVIDPQRGRFLFLDRPSLPVPTPDSVRVDYHYGFSGPIGAGGESRTPVGPVTPTVALVKGAGIAALNPSDVVEIGDSATYDAAGGTQSATNLVLRAKDSQRPYVRVDTQGWTFVGSGGDASLTIDGLWLGGPGSLIVAGDFATVRVRRATFDPGGTDADGQVLAPVALTVTGSVKQLVVEDSIMGPIIRSGAGLVETATITRSIVQGAPRAIDIDTGVTNLSAVTIFGDALVHRTQATEVIVDGVMTTINSQDGCFRFGVAHTTSTLPHPYESHFTDDMTSAFLSRRFGDPGYAQLTSVAPAFIRRGGENLVEMGAFRDLLTPLKLDDLQKKVEEYMPFGLVPIFLLET